MFSIFRRSQEIPSVPDWASFFKNKEYVEFLKSIEDYFSKRNIHYDINDGILSTDTSVFGFTSLGLLNVAQVCKQSKLKNYGKIVSEHFESMVRAYQFDVEFRAMAHDYDKVQKYIGVRLYSEAYVGALEKGLTITKHFSGDVYAMLVFDLPDSIINVQPEQANKWGKTTDELFNTGLQNIKDKYPIDISRQHFDEFSFWFAQGDHFFAPNVVFNLKTQKTLVGSGGSIVGIPHRHAVIIYPIENSKVRRAIDQLIPVIYGMNVEGPGSISNNIFWYQDGHFENLPYKIEDNKVKFFPSDTFLQLLNRFEQVG